MLLKMRAPTLGWWRGQDPKGKAQLQLSQPLPYAGTDTDAYGERERGGGGREGEMDKSLTAFLSSL